MGQLIRVSDLANNEAMMNRASFLYNEKFTVTAIFGSNGQGSYLVQLLSKEDPARTADIEVIPGSALLSMVKA